VDINEEDCELYFLEGWDLSNEEIKKYKKEIGDDPQKVSSRLVLLGYYRKKLLETESKESEKTYQEHLVYLIQHFSENGIFSSPLFELQPEFAFDENIYNYVKPLWLKCIKDNPDNYKIFENAATFFLPFDKNLTEKLLLKAKELEPDNTSVVENLSRVYDLDKDTKNNESRRKNIIKSLAQLELALNEVSISDRNQKILNFVRIIETALLANMLDEVSKYSNILLKVIREYHKEGAPDGDVIHDVNIVLGQMAFQLGNIEQAKIHLVDAGKTPGSPKLDSFGPDTTLAEKLLSIGELDTVINYLELCKKFWEINPDKLDKWIDLIKNGKIPELDKK